MFGDRCAGRSHNRGRRAADPAALADGEAVVELHRQLERLTAVATRAAAAFDSGRAWEADGARSAAAWLSARGRTPLTTARRRVRAGRSLRSMPAAEAAWLAGEIGEAHAEALAAVRRRVGGEVFDPDESRLVGHARDLPHRDFWRVLGYWTQAADPDGVEDDARAQRGARRLHLSQTLDGMWLLDGVLDPLSGEVVANALKKVEQELFEAEWAEAKAPTRTPAQRRADALVELARRAGAVPPGARLPEPLLSVFVGYETFAGRICQLASGAAVAPGSLLPWLTGAYVERVVFDGPDRVKNVGVRRRLFGAPPAGRWRCETGSASRSSATSPPTTARSTTSSPSAGVGSPSTTTVGRRARSTTAGATTNRRDGGRFLRRRVGYRP